MVIHLGRVSFDTYFDISADQGFRLRGMNDVIYLTNIQKVTVCLRL